MIIQGPKISIYQTEVIIAKFSMIYVTKPLVNLINEQQ